MRYKEARLGVLLTISVLLACKMGVVDTRIAEEGDRCAQEGETACTKDGLAQLTCDSSKQFVKTDDCLGPEGCKVGPTGQPVTFCDLTRSKVGGVCSEEGNPACSVDGQTRLVCKDGKQEFLEPCRGPAGCRFESTGENRGVYRCDHSIVQAGDPCFKPGTGACDPSHRTRMICKNGKWVADKRCDGPKGCQAVSTADGRTGFTCDASGASTGNR